MLPCGVVSNGIPCRLGPKDSADAVTAEGQTIQLPAGGFNRLYLLAASYDGDQTATFRVGGDSVRLTIEDWGGYIGQWDNRVWQERKVQRDGRWHTEMEYAGLEPGFIKRASLGWFASHHHGPDGSNEAYQYSYLFAYGVPLPAGATTLTLPDNPRIRILAASVARETAPMTPAHPLYDTLARDAAAVKATMQEQR